MEAQIAALHRAAGIEGRGRNPVDAVLLTHAHVGHYLGLAQFGRPGVDRVTGLPVGRAIRTGSYLTPMHRSPSHRNPGLTTRDPRIYSARPLPHLQPQEVGN